MNAYDRAVYAERRRLSEAQVIAELREQGQQNWIRVCREMSDIGPHFEQRRLDTYQPQTPLQRKALEHCQAIVRGDEPAGVYLYGAESGVGKTHLAAGIVNAAIEQGIPAVFTVAAVLIQRIRSTYGRSGAVREGERDIIERLARVKVLVLDDLGTEPFTPDTARLFYLLLNERIERDLPLIVTSNLSPADLGIAWAKSGVETHLGRKIIDRINGMCPVVAQVDGESMRGAAS